MNMFKKECRSCGKKVDRKFRFCPFCGHALRKQKKEDWGMLGQTDAVNPNEFSNNLFGGGMLNRMLGNVMKMVEKELQREMQQPQPKNNFELIVNGKRVDPSKIKIATQKVQPKTQKKDSSKNFSKEASQKYGKLPKKEPITNMKRFSDRLVYEFEIPKIRSLDDVSIVNFENSIEVKAITKDKAYSKRLQVSLPVADYYVSDDKLILELLVK